MFRKVRILLKGRTKVQLVFEYKNADWMPEDVKQKLEKLVFWFFKESETSRKRKVSGGFV